MIQNRSIQPFRLAFQEKNLNAMRLFVRYAPDEVLVMYFTKLLPEIKKSTDNEKFFSDLFGDQASKDKAKQAYESLKANPPSYLVGRVQISHFAKIGLIYLGKFFD